MSTPRRKTLQTLKVSGGARARHKGQRGAPPRALVGQEAAPATGPGPAAWRPEGAHERCTFSLAGCARPRRGQAPDSPPLRSSGLQEARGTARAVRTGPRDRSAGIVGVTGVARRPPHPWPGQRSRGVASFGLGLSPVTHKPTGHGRRRHTGASPASRRGRSKGAAQGEPRGRLPRLDRTRPDPTGRGGRLRERLPTPRREPGIV